MKKLEAMFDDAPIHCPCCWSTNVVYKNNKGYRCYNCQPEKSWLQEMFGSFWYFNPIS